ncbi:hypothetical protein [Roseovarius aestuarii]|nr:hypothetical protein [Roseovarius aestuarii]
MTHCPEFKMSPGADIHFVASQPVSVMSDGYACSKGLRNCYCIEATMNGVLLNLLQLWTGRASMTTTAINANANGGDELAIADRTWR